jgi:hypothetical protein
VPNRIVASGRYDDKANALFCSETDQGNEPIVAFHHPQPGVYKFVFDPTAFLGPVTLLATSSGVAGGLTTDASVFVRNTSQNECNLVTVVFDRATNALITQDAGFYFTIIEHSGGFQINAT